MNPVPLINVINQSVRIPEEAVSLMANAMGQQLVDVARVHGATPAIEYVPPNVQGSDEGAPCYIIDTPDVEGALGYHDVDADGKPYLKVFVNPILDNGGTALRGDNSVSATLSHEILEVVGDADANLWADGPEGFDYAFELCDAVESDVYEVEGVSVSNWLLRSFFQPKLNGKRNVRFDFLNLVERPLQMRPGGYMIQRTENGRVTDIFANRRGSVHVDQGIVLSFGPQFPNWKRPYKMRKAHHHAAINHFRRTGKVYLGGPR